MKEPRGKKGRKIEGRKEGSKYCRMWENGWKGEMYSKKLGRHMVQALL
jgi:hypothetical protein